MIKQITYLFEISTEIHYYYKSNLKPKDRLKDI